MSLGSITFVVVLLYTQGVLSRYATVNLSLNLSAQLSDDNNQQLTDEKVRICMKETQLSMAELERFKANEIMDSETNESTQCFAHCLYEQMGLMKHGIFVDNDDTQRLLAEPENPEFAVCRSIRGSNKCDTAYKIHQCIQKVKFGPHEDSSIVAARETSDDDGSSDDSQGGN